METMKSPAIYISDSALQTEKIATDFAKTLSGGDLLALHGELGSGKTCFVRGLANGLNCVQPAKSPTFNIINEYHGDITLIHIDLYRMNNYAEILDLGWTDYLDSSAIVVVEWAEKAKNMLPLDRYDIYFAIQGDENRRIEIVANGNTGNR